MARSRCPTSPLICAYGSLPSIGYSDARGYPLHRAMTVGAEGGQLVDRRQLRPAACERADVVHLERDADGAALLAAALGVLEHLLA
jgi:hypothetical protein